MELKQDIDIIRIQSSEIKAIEGGRRRRKEEEKKTLVSGGDKKIRKNKSRKRWK